MPVYSAPEKANDALTELLLRAAPLNQHGHPTITALADSLGLSRWAVQKWILNQKMTPDRVIQVVRISKGSVTREDFESFVYKE